MHQVIVAVAKNVTMASAIVANGKELEDAVDADIAQFDEYFQRELKNDPLVRSEIAILKTYLFWKTHQETTDAREESSAVRV